MLGGTEYAGSASYYINVWPKFLFDPSLNRDVLHSVHRSSKSSTPEPIKVCYKNVGHNQLTAPIKGKMGANIMSHNLTKAYINRTEVESNALLVTAQEVNLNKSGSFSRRIKKKNKTARRVIFHTCGIVINLLKRYNVSQIQISITNP